MVGVDDRRRVGIAVVIDRQPDGLALVGVDRPARLRGGAADAGAHPIVVLVRQLVVEDRDRGYLLPSDGARLGYVRAGVVLDDVAALLDLVPAPHLEVDRKSVV